MGKKELLINDTSVEHAIKKGLKQIGLPQSKTIIRIKQKESHNFFHRKPAVVTILFDEDESHKALLERAREEFMSRMVLRFEESKIKIRVMGTFFYEGIFESDEERQKFLMEFLEAKGIHKPDEEAIDTIIKHPQSQGHFVTIKTLDTIPLNKHGGALFIEISADKMSCRAAIFHHGEIKEEQIYDVLKKKGIIKGILKQTLSAVIKNKYQGFFEIAVGLPPVPDTPTKFKVYFQESEHRLFSDLMGQHTVDMRNVKDINIVNRNELLMELTDPIPGKNGYTVTGVILDRETASSRGGLKLGPNVYMSDNNKQVYAKAAGHIVWRPHEPYIDVENIYVVEGNVDFAEGNIIGFVGKVLVKGDVRPKFSVIAEGDIEIQGSVEDAIVESTNGNVTVMGTIVHKNEGHVRATETVHANLVINANIKARNIVVEKEVMNSKLYASSKISILGQPGVLVGGEVFANHLIRVNTIGSENWVQTKVHSGDVTELKKLLYNIRKRMADQQDKLKELQATVKLLKAKEQTSELTETQTNQLEGAIGNIPTLKDNIEYDQDEETKIVAEMERMRNAKIEVIKTIYPHCDLYIYDSYLLTSEEEHYKKFTCRESVILCLAL